MKQTKITKRTALILAVCLLSVLLAALIGAVILLEHQSAPGGNGETALPDPKETVGASEETNDPTEETGGATDSTRQTEPTGETGPNTEPTRETEPNTEPTRETDPPTEPTKETGPVTEPTQPTEPVTEPVQDPNLIELETPVCALYFPRLWEDYLHIDPAENGYRMEFSFRHEGDGTYRLFDISFGTPNGTVLGVVTGLDGTVVQVSILFYEPDETLEGDLLETYLAMQEDANQLIALLPLTEGGPPPQTWEDILIQTPFCELTYPGQWEQYLRVEHSGGEDYVVDFYAQFDGEEKIHLFSVKFGTDTEDALMVLTDTGGDPVGVNVELAEVSQSLPQDRLDVVYAMQDAMNELLDALSENLTD